MVRFEKTAWPAGATRSGAASSGGDLDGKARTDRGPGQRPRAPGAAGLHGRLVSGPCRNRFAPASEDVILDVEGPLAWFRTRARDDLLP